jgi:hypothetical protein
MRSATYQSVVAQCGEAYRGVVVGADLGGVIDLAGALPHLAIDQPQ